MTLAQQIDELPDKSEIVFIPYANTQQICDAIKGLPEGSLLSASFDERYQVVGAIDDLKALVAENESLKEHIQKIVDFGSQDVTLEVYKEIVHHESVEILTGKPSGYDFDGGNDD